MKKNSRFVFGIASLVLAAILAFIAVPAVSRMATGKVEIVRVTAAIPKGTVIDDTNTEIASVGGFGLPAVARTKEEVIGKYATADLLPGDYILHGKVSATPLSSDAALNSLPSDKAAISLSIKSLAAGLSGKLQPNDIVRVYSYNEGIHDVPELQFVKVLAVTDASGTDLGTVQPETDTEEKQEAAAITVLASPVQAQAIARLENEGSTHIALISRGDDTLASELLARQDDILSKQ